MEQNNEVWGIVELMGHLTLAGRLTKPGEYGGLWQVDIPEEETFRTEFFASGSVYRIRIVSEEIARAYSHRTEIIEYDAPIVTRDEHERVVERARDELFRVQRENEELRRRLTAVQALPQWVTIQSELDHTEEDEDEDPDFEDHPES